jgi:hypothetical protein
VTYQAFIRDYELLSYALDHKYYCIVCYRLFDFALGPLLICASQSIQWNDREYTKDEWILNNGNVEAGRLHDGTEIAVSVALLLVVITSWYQESRADSSILASSTAGCGVYQVVDQESGPEYDIE